MKEKATLIVLVMLALISTWYISRTIILPHIDARIEHANKILSGQQGPPYQYRVLKPLLGKGMEAVVSTVTENERWRHVISYTLLSFITFLGIFMVFHAYLGRDFSAGMSLIGVLLMMAVIPLTATGYYMEGDYINLLFFILGLFLIRSGKDGYLPVLIGLGALNREQIIFILVWYFAYLIAQRKVTGRRIVLAFISLMVWLAVLIGIRMYFGVKPSQYTFALHMASNTDINLLFTLIIPLWMSNVAGFVVMSTLAFGKSNTFYRLSFMSLIVYGVLFFFNGFMWELAKFLPAYLILIPMSLQTVTGEFAVDGNAPDN